MRLPIYQVDAFADRVFGGNPAAVCPLEAGCPTRAAGDRGGEQSLGDGLLRPRGRRLRAALVHAGGRGRPVRPRDARAGHVVFAFLRAAARPGRFHTKGGELTVAKRAICWRSIFRPGARALRAPPLGLAGRSAPAGESGPRATTSWSTTAAGMRGAAAGYRRAGAASIVAVTRPRRAARRTSSRASSRRPGHRRRTRDRLGALHADAVLGGAARQAGALSARQISRRGGELACEASKASASASPAGAVLYLEGRISVLGRRSGSAT